MKSIIQFTLGLRALLSIATITTSSLLSPAFAQSGTITGTAPKVRQFLAGSTRLYSLTSPVTFGRELTAKRSYRLTVPEGPYVVVSEVTGKGEKLFKVNVVSATRGKRTVVRSRAALETPPSIRVSVGNILLRTPTGRPVKAVNGKNITVDDLVIVDLLNSKNSCGFAIVEDRKFGRYKDILKEVRLQSSRFAANPINLKSALDVLNANAPQYRLTGSVEVTEDQDLTGNANLQIVNLGSGKVVWQKQFRNGEKRFGKFSEPLAQAAADALCIPQEISGTFTGRQDITGGGIALNYTWVGNARFTFQSYISDDPTKPTDYTAAIYQYNSGEITSYSVSGTNNGCSVTGNSSAQQPEFPSSGLLLVYLKPIPGVGYRYSLGVSLVKQSGVSITNACPSSVDTRTDAATAELVTSNSEDDLPTTPSLRNFSGSFTLEDTVMTWDFNAQL